MKNLRQVNILFVVCHPDDEALWVGGLIHGLQMLDGVTVYVICLCGDDDPSLRKLEFESAKKVAGYHWGVVMGGRLGAASEPLPPVGKVVADGLEKLKLPLQEIDLMVTHSPYGDEHMHPHHVQACEELYDWARVHCIPFGYFSCVPLPNATLEPTLKNMKRYGALQLLNYAWCKYSILSQLLKRCGAMPWRYPRLYTQWLVNAEIKNEMLSCYKSIGLEQHREGYAMFSSNVETVYVFDQRGVRVIDRIVESMETPGAEDFFLGTWISEGIKAKVIRRLTSNRGV